MNHWLNPHPAVLLIGHRGASAHAPENTVAALRLAHEQGAHGVEFDVKLCKTGEVVLMHDTTVNRTTNGTGPVHALSLAELRALDAGKGERVPLLDEVFDAMKPAMASLHGQTLPFLFNVEVTNYETQGDGLEAAVAEVVRRHGMQERVLFSSFSPPTLALLQQHAPEVPRGFLYHPMHHQSLREQEDAGLLLAFRHPHVSTVTPEYVARHRAEGILVNTWTVNLPADMRRMAECGVCGIIGDSPKTMLEVLGG